MRTKNFGLSEQEFDHLVTNLQNGNEELFELVYLKHFKSCVDYLRSEYGANYTDAYDCVMGTLIDFRKSLLDGKIIYGNIRYLYTRMSINKFLKSKKRNSKIELRAILPETSISENKYTNEELNLLNKAWDQLGEGCKSLLKSYYYKKIKLVAIAEQLEKTPAAIRKQKERCVQLLRNNFLRFI